MDDWGLLSHLGGGEFAQLVVEHEASVYGNSQFANYASQMPAEMVVVNQRQKMQQYSSAGGTRQS
jgi:hypothetical protein